MCVAGGLALAAHAYDVRLLAMSEAERRKFLHDELFSLTLMATAQRGKVYAEGTTEAQRRPFQKRLRQSLEDVAKCYAQVVSEDAHYSNISTLANALSRSHATVLKDRRFRIGSAQKALNLFLKYLWCIGEIPTPPHCPFDFQIIQKLPRSARRNWTQIETIDDYRFLVAERRKLRAAGHSLNGNFNSIMSG